MKKNTFLLLALVIIISNTTFAQVAINADGAEPNSNSMLDVKSTTKGMLIPRMTTLERTTMDDDFGTAERGMLVYDWEQFAFYYFDGASSWIKIAMDGMTDDDWFVNGDDMYSLANGDIGIGKSSNFQGKLDVNGKIYANNPSGDGVQVYTAGNAGSTWGSSLNNGFEVNGAEGNGVFVGKTKENGLYVQNATKNGVSINNADIDGVNILSATRYGVFMNTVGNKGINILGVGSVTGHTSTEKNGFDVAGAEGNGLYVGQAVADGVKIYKAGAPAGVKSSTYSNGVEVNGAQGNGVYVGRVNRSGIEIDSAGQYGLKINKAIGDAIRVTNTDAYGLHILQTTEDAIYVENAGSNGISIDNAGANGISVYNATSRGIYVGTAGTDGLYINKAGNPTTTSTSNSKNGIEIAGAEGYGIYIGQADYSGVYVANTEGSGVYVNDATYSGIYIQQAGNDGVSINVAAADGVSIQTANDDGIYINYAGNNGVYVDGAVSNGVYANTTRGDQEWGIYTPDKIHGIGVTSKSSSTYGLNIGNATLQVGDVVCIAGGMENNIDGTENLFAINLEMANESNRNAVFGVVEYKVNIKTNVKENKISDNETVRHEDKAFAFADGDVYAGDYFSVIILGPAEVNIDSKTNIKVGDNVCISNNGVSSQRVTEVNGISIAENVGILGKSMETASGKGKMLVYVNCK